MKSRSATPKANALTAIMRAMIDHRISRQDGGEAGISTAGDRSRYDAR